MKTKNLFISCPAIVLLLAVFGCKNQSANGYETDPSSGIQYHFFSHAENGTKPSIGDYAEIMMTMKNSKDSVIFNSAKREGFPDSIKTLKIRMRESFRGCLPEGLTLMSMGDSASFLISADSLYHKTFKANNLPYYVQAGSMLTINVKLIGIETEEQAKAERDKKAQEYETMAQQRKGNETSEIVKYLGENNIKAKAEQDGMYILKDEKGKGKGIKEGDSVEVQYTTTLLDGTVVEESDHGTDRTTYFICYKKEHELQGIDDVLANMKEGETITALFPSSLAYGGEKQGMLIEPYTPLIFEIKVVKVKPGK